MWKNMPLEGPEIVRPKEINNKPALRRCYDQMKLDYDWIERLDLITDTGVQFDDKDVNDDFNREQVFYKQAQAAIMEAVPRLKAAGIKVRKPNDYFAEMIKSESHMDRIKRAYAEREAIMEKIEKAKRIRKERKMAKMVQTQVKISKQEEKKEFNSKIAKFKKGIDKNLDFLEDSGKKNVKKDTKEKKDPKKPTKKTAYKLQKYGLGGQKKRKKYNTAESSADVSSFSGRQNRGPKIQGKANRGGKKKGGKGGKQKRPGKERRKQMKMRSSRKR